MADDAGEIVPAGSRKPFALCDEVNLFVKGQIRSNRLGIVIRQKSEGF